MTTRFVLYRFRYRDQVTGKRVAARYAAEQRDIEARYREWEIVGAPERREVQNATAYFHPYRAAAAAELKRLQERPPQLNAHLERSPDIDAAQHFLIGLFLRRYVTYCLRRRRFAQMQGVARLYREVVGM